MAIEKGDWVRLPMRFGVEGVVEDVRGRRVRVRLPDGMLIESHPEYVHIAARPQTGRGSR